MQRWESVRKLIAIILIPFLLAIPSFATGESCPEQLNISGELTHQIDQMINATPGWFARRRLAKSLAQMQPKLADRITKVCGSVANCSAQDLALATSVSLREALATLDSPTQSLLRPFCGLVVALATNAGLQILLSQSLPQIMPAQYATVVASSINTFTTILIFALGAPILERLQNRVRQWALKERTVTSTTKNPHLDGFEQTYWASQALWGIPGLAGRNIHRTVVSEIRYPLSMAAIMATVDQGNGMDKAAALIAQLLHDLHLYAEVEPLRYSDQAYIWFGRSYVTEKNFESFQTEIVEYLKVLDPKIVTDPETREFYTRIIHSWFRPRLRTQILGE